MFDRIIKIKVAQNRLPYIILIDLLALALAFFTLKNRQSLSNS